MKSAYGKGYAKTSPSLENAQSDYDEWFRQNKKEVVANYKERKRSGIKEGGNEFAMKEYIAEKFAQTDGNVKHLGKEEADEVLLESITQRTADRWFREADSEAKPQVVKAVISNQQSRNAALSVMYDNYKEAHPNSEMTFSQFLDSPITMYRGGHGQSHTKDDVFSAYTWDRKIAQKFAGSDGTIYEAKIKPIDTYGSVQRNGEMEIMVPSQIAPNGNKDSEEVLPDGGTFFDGRRADMKSRDTPTRRVRRLDCIRLDKNDSTYFTDEGYLVDHPILTSCGIFEYTNPDGSVRRELRLPENVFDENSLKTYRGKPIIITHDAGVVDKNNVDKEQIGTILSDGYQDGEDVRAEIIIHDTDSMKKSGLKELSLGYNLDLVEKPGVWNGEPYDAVQTNIVINHLALVASARAGEQARLNIDGSDEPELKGGKAMARVKNSRRTDGGTLSPEELEQAIAAYKARKAERTSADEDPEQAAEADSEEEMEEDSAPDAEEEEAEDCDDAEKTDGDDEPEAQGSTPEEIAQTVKERRDRRDAEEEPKDADTAMGVIAQQDEDIDMLLACIEKMLAEAKAKDNTDSDEEEEEKEDGEDCEENKDSSEDQSKSLNADSADRIVRQRLRICRVGDKLHMDGLEDMSIRQAKKAIIAKVLPNMRMDGKSDAYIDAMYDLAVGEATKRKDVNYQRQQMQKQGAKRRADSNESMAASARKNMIEREGGNE